jgi:hypothetical protein
MGGASWDDSGADCSAGSVWVGVSLPGVLFARVFVLFQLRDVKGCLGEFRQSFYLLFRCNGPCFALVSNPLDLRLASVTAFGLRWTAVGLGALALL